MHKLLTLERPFAPLLNALDANICVIDSQGVIILVNAAWETFALDNGASELSSIGVGTSYLDVCDSAAAGGDPYAPLVSAGLRSVLNGSQPRFDLEYPCHSSEEERYFLLTATPIMIDGTIECAVIVHQNVSPFRIELQDSVSLLSYYRVLVEGNAPRTASLLGDRPLRQRLPKLFDSLSIRYRALLPRYLESRVVQVTPPRLELGQIAWQLGEAGAGPRDVIDLHVESLDILVKGTASFRKNSMIIEGRLMALELMGYLVDYYRHPARQQRSAEEA